MLYDNLADWCQINESRARGHPPVARANDADSLILTPLLVITSLISH